MKKSVGIALTAVFLLLSATFLLFADSGGRLTSAITIPSPPSPFEAASATQPIEIPPPPSPFEPAPSTPEIPPPPDPFAPPSGSTEPELPPPPDPFAPPAPSGTVQPAPGGGGTGGGGRGGGGSRGMPRNQTIPIVPPPTTAQPAPAQPPLTPGFEPTPTTPFEPEPFTPQPAPQPYIPPAPEIEIPEEGTAWWWILLIIILILIILLILFLIWKHYRDKKERLAKLKGYIMICLKQGFKPDEIKAKLLRYGWNEKEVKDMTAEVITQIEEEKRRASQGKATIYSGMYGGINSAGSTVSRTRGLTQQQKPATKPTLGMKK